MNDMSLLLDLMRGWLALLSVVATLLWLLYPKEPQAHDAALSRGLDFVDQPDAGPPGAAAARSASRVRRTSTSGMSEPVPPVLASWYPEQLDLHTGSCSMPAQ